MPTVLSLAQAVLDTGNPPDKIKAVNTLTNYWSKGGEIGNSQPALNDHPERPLKPVLVDPRGAKRRRLGTEAGRAALLHAVAHIEFNAINLAADMLARFALDKRISNAQRSDFCNDWISVCADEARHFSMVETRMGQMGVIYGDHPAHNGLWEAALATKDSFAARLAIAPLVLEARGLDVTPSMIEKLEAQNDMQSADVLRVIYTDEVGHVRIGKKWFEHIAKHTPESEVIQFHSLVRRYFKGNLKRPFNEPARTKAGLPPEFYEPLANK